MHHSELVEGIKKVTAALQECGLRTALAPADEPGTEQLLDALRRYAIDAARFTPAEQTVSDLLGISDLDSSTVWARLLAGGTVRAHYFDRVGFVTHHLPRFVELLEESRTSVSDHALRVQVAAEDERGIGAAKAVTLVNSLSTLYRACAEVNGISVDDLMLSSVEGGRDTVLMFDGMAAALGYVKELLTAAFRWLALYRDEELDMRLERAKSSLPPMQAIATLTESGTFTSEQADQLQQDILLALITFFDAGAIIPELEADLAQSPREIVATPGPPPSAIQEPADGQDEEHVTVHDSVIELEGDEMEMIEEG